MKQRLEPIVTRKHLLLTGLFFLLFLYRFTAFAQQADRFVTFTANPAKDEIRFYLKDDKGNYFRSIGNLRSHLEAKKKTLRFAMNGGMYQIDNRPLGLYIQNAKTIEKLNTRSGNGNFYLQPNGVFYLTSANKAGISPTKEFKNPNVTYATQSGPMLVVNGEINAQFKKGSENLNIRNGVGILPDGRILFALSKEPVNFYDFAAFFKSRGCRQALYLDGFVSRAYLPEKRWTQLDGDFGVIIGVTR